MHLASADSADGNHRLAQSPRARRHGVRPTLPPPGSTARLALPSQLQPLTAHPDPSAAHPLHELGFDRRPHLLSLIGCSLDTWGSASNTHGYRWVAIDDRDLLNEIGGGPACRKVAGKRPPSAPLSRAGPSGRLWCGRGPRPKPPIPRPWTRRRGALRPLRAHQPEHGPHFPAGRPRRATAH